MNHSRHLLASLLLIAASAIVPAVGQIAPAPDGIQSATGPLFTIGTSPLMNASSASAPPTTQPLIDFKDSEIKFRLETLMSTLRDHRHEGWVLAAYPDPKTRRPLIGAGFSLDVERVEHPQRDPLNPHPFLEPSSSELWMAAGLRAERLDQILARFQERMKEGSFRRVRRRVRARAPASEVTEEEATRLLRISAIQAIYNAKAYCRSFDKLSGPQQMALSQLVFQMGVNLEEFVQFLAALNSDFAASVLSQIKMPAESPNQWNQQHWKTVQDTLIDSQWARLYSDRAASVIAMFDPAYPDDPVIAQQRIQSTLRPAVIVRRRRHSGVLLRTASLTRRTSKSGHNSGVKTRVNPRRGRSRKA